jgi:SWI/SNF-related matrix-associated actin-dependent regulator of chromatin subfamily D
LKRQFLQSFAEDPFGFIQTWLASQSCDLESILGSGPSEGATIHKEDLSRSEFFRMPWVEEAVAIWDEMCVANKVIAAIPQLWQHIYLQNMQKIPFFFIPFT